ncbi:MAG: NAD(P)-binding domain-containing protein [Nannocystaceae bacterium]
MKYAVLGTGMVGNTIGKRLVSLGHEVKMGSRSADNPKAAAFVAEAGKGASQGTFADAAAHADVIFNCTAGGGSLAALEAAGADNLAGKILIDVSNPLDFSRGFPPSLSVCNTDSLGEQLQRAFPALRVVKALNTVNCLLMVEPARVPGDHVTFVAGNDAAAKAQVQELLREFGWRSILDLGDITMARGLEAYLLLWIRLYGALGTADFNVSLTRAAAAAH